MIKNRTHSEYNEHSSIKQNYFLIIHIWKAIQFIGGMVTYVNIGMASSEYLRKDTDIGIFECLRKIKLDSMIVRLGRHKIKRESMIVRFG